MAIAFVSDAATERQERQLGRRIAILPEVERYAFMSKEAGLAFYELRFGGQRFVARYGAGPVFSSPMGFWMVLRDGADLSAVAQAIGSDPALRRDDSPFRGVRTAKDFYAAMRRINGETTSQ